MGHCPLVFVSEQARPPVPRSLVSRSGWIILPAPTRSQVPVPSVRPSVAPLTLSRFPPHIIIVNSSGVATFKTAPILLPPAEVTNDSALSQYYTGFSACSTVAAAGKAGLKLGQWANMIFFPFYLRRSAYRSMDCKSELKELGWETFVL